MKPPNNTFVSYGMQNCGARDTDKLLFDYNRDENCYLADQSLPLWGRWIAEGETDEGGTMFYVHKHFGEMGNPHPTSLTLGHLPQRGRLWCSKFQFDRTYGT